ncbi:MAG TPA: hypothetical protein VK828_17060 [Terriglobales bacterium]|nr:hypothetical protein [Terriglobales bacterium]
MAILVAFAFPSRLSSNADSIASSSLLDASPAWDGTRRFARHYTRLATLAAMHSCWRDGAERVRPKRVAVVSGPQPDEVWLVVLDPAQGAEM